MASATRRITSIHLLVVVFMLGFGTGIITFYLHSTSEEYYHSRHRITTEAPADSAATGSKISETIFETKKKNSNNIYLDPFPLPSCSPNRTSALYVFYGFPILSHYGDTLFKSIDSLLKSNFPGNVRVIIDETINATIRTNLPKKYQHLLPSIHFDVVRLPNINGVELIPHSNKIRALQAKAFTHTINDGDSRTTKNMQETECTISLDTDTYISPHAPWKQLLSTLELNEFAVTKDCEVQIDDVPEYLRYWMPNTGVLAMRNTPRARLVLEDWLSYYRPCNATDASTCMPGTDQYPFLQLMVKHAVRFYKLETAWNCRITEEEPEEMNRFPLYAVSVLTNKASFPNEIDDAKIKPTCGGFGECHILHGHFLTYFKE